MLNKSETLWKIFEMSLIHCEINLMLTSVISDVNGGTTFAITYIQNFIFQ